MSDKRDKTAEQMQGEWNYRRGDMIKSHPPGPDQWYIDKVESLFKKSNHLKTTTENLKQDKWEKAASAILEKEISVGVFKTKEDDSKKIYDIKINNLKVGIIIISSPRKELEEKYHNNQKLLWDLSLTGIMDEKVYMILEDHKTGEIILEKTSQVEKMMKYILMHKKGIETVTKTLAREIKSSNNLSRDGIEV